MNIFKNKIKLNINLKFQFQLDKILHMYERREILQEFYFPESLIRSIPIF